MQRQLDKGAILQQLKELRGQGMLDEQIFWREQKMLEEGGGGKELGAGVDLFATGGVVGLSGSDNTPRGGRYWPGQQIAGRYDVMALLGVGGMGQVYLVYDHERERPIALKCLHDVGDLEARERLIRREIALNERLTHPGIVRTYSLQRDLQTRQLLLTMEYVPGKSLRALLEDWMLSGWFPPPLSFRVHLLRQIATAVSYAHTQDIVHRDLKPDNVLVDPGGDARLLDFGIAQEGGAGEGQTAVGWSGTAYYMAPEQLQGKRCTAATDVYALGVMAFQLLTGQLPQPGVPGVSVLAPGLPVACDAIVARALHWEPAARYSPATDFCDALEACLIPKTPTFDGDGDIESEASAGGVETSRGSGVGVVVEQATRSSQGVSVGLEVMSGQVAEGVGQKSAEFGRMMVFKERHLEILRQRIDRKRPSWLGELYVRRMPAIAEIGVEELNALRAPWWPVFPAFGEGSALRLLLSRGGRPLLPLLKIPEGTFWMGARDEDVLASGHERPCAEVFVHTFWSAGIPVTNGVWAIFLEESGYQPPKARQGSYLRHWKQGRFGEGQRHHPVVWVGYEDVWAFCDFYGLSLPSEAQWEKGAGGTEQQRYPWGEQSPTRELCNFGRLEGGVTEVCARPGGRSPYGLLDCAGNVYEWCADGWEPRYLEGVASQEPVVLAQKRKRVVVRGGGYHVKPELVRVSARMGLSTEQPNSHTGFRPIFDARR